MAAQEFMCEKCQKTFELTMTSSEHEKGRIRCPTCKSTRVATQLGDFTTQTSRKS
jgi:putative FmdB family regulatory protein